MATREEIIQQYQEDRLDKILRLKTILSSRISQNAKAKANVINGVSVISTTLTIDDIFSVEELKTIYSRDGSSISDLRSQMKPIRKEIVDKLSERLDDPDSTVIFLIITCELINVSVSDEKEMLSCALRVRDTLYVKEPGRPAEKLSTSNTSNASGTSPVQWVEGSSFTDISKNLSGVSYPNENLQQSNKFENWLTDITMFQRFKELQPFETMPIFVHSEMSLGDFNLIFPKPDGYVDDSVPNTPTTPSDPSVPSVPSTPSTPSTPSVSGDPSSTTEVPTITTPSSNEPKNYTSIEAVRNDDPNVSNTPSEEQEEQMVIISNRFIADEDIGRSFRDGTLSAIKSEEVENKTGSPPPTPIEDVNKRVVENQAEALRKKTRAQRELEEADSLEKLKAKEKLATAPAVPSPDAPDGKAAKKQENAKPIPADEVPPKNTKNDSTHPIWKTWIKKDGQPSVGDKFILNRSGLGEKPYLVADISTTPQINAVSDPKRFKSLFDYGKSLDKFFSGYKDKIKSPIDVALLCNTQYVGGFNKNVPYIFAEGSETQLVVIRSYKDRLSDGVLGKAAATKNEGNLDANWSENPYWCGLTVDFLLYANGEYISDESNLPIVGTPIIPTYFSKSPVNPIGGTETTKKRELSAIEGDITSKKTTINSITLSLNKLNKKRSDTIAALTEIQADNLVNKTPAGINKEKTKNIDLEKTESNIENKQSQKLKLENEIKELETQRERINNTPSSKFNKDGTVAKFELGVHFIENQGLTTEGLELWEQIKDWQGAYIVRRKRWERIDKGVKKTGENGHVELLLHFGKDGRIFVIFGNSSYNDGNSNGQSLDFKKYNSIGEFVGGKPLRGSAVYIVKRGVKSPYTNSISTTVTKTDLYNEYVSRMNSNDPVLDPRAYNILREIMGDKI